MTDIPRHIATCREESHQTRREAVLRQPPIVLSPQDRDELSAIAICALMNAPRSAGALLDEVDRADIRPDSTIGMDVVGLGSIVTYSDDRRAGSQTVQVVAPTDVGDDPTRISVLGSVGAGLIGLRTGQSILWADRLGSEHVLKVLTTIRRLR